MSAAIAVWAVVTAFGIAAQPIARAVFAPLPGAGAGMARPLGLLLAGAVLWFLASLRIVPFTDATAWIALIALAVVGAAVWWRTRGRERPRHGLLLLAGSEVVFLVTFLAGLYVISHNPDIWGTERPLDMMLVNTIDNTRDFPPLDPWLSGYDLNYYYLGQYLMVVLIKISGVPTDEGYNVGIALVFALGASAAFGLGGMAAGMLRRWKGTLLGATALAGLTVIGGNWLGTYLLLDNDGGLASFDWFAASRAVPGAVNDFPAFEVVVGDLHAHVIAVPFTLLACAFGLHALTQGPVLSWRTAAAAAVVGGLYPINAWSAPVAGAVVLACGALGGAPLKQYLKWAAALIGLSLLFYLPFHLGTSASQTGGIKTVPDRQGLGTFLVDLFNVYGYALLVVLVVIATRLGWRGRLGFLAAGAVALLFSFTGDLGGPALVVVAIGTIVWLGLRREQEPIARFGLVLAGIGFGCILAGELVYLSDAFDGGENFRFNTVFKAGFNAWLLLGASAGVLLAVAARRARYWAVPLIAIAAAGLVFPYAAAYQRTGGFEAAARLDGLRWLATFAPGEEAAIDWIRENTAVDDVVLEANGPEYSPQGHARISVYTGRPTVLGWAGHLLFYHPPELQGSRATDIATIYSTPDPAVARRLLERYEVKWVVIGPIEQLTYPELQAAKYAEHREKVFETRGTAVYSVTVP